MVAPHFENFTVAMIMEYLAKQIMGLRPVFWRL